MRFDILTIFPNLVLPYFEDSILKRGKDSGDIEFHVHNIRDYSKDKHNKVDDTPYGGGAGMLMTCQPLFDAIRAVKKENKGPVIFMSPQGKRFNQEKANELSKLNEIILLCGRYEGIDQRVRDELVDIEISTGDFVLTGGELPALTIIDAVSRLIPGVLGAEDSAHDDSFSEGMDGMLEHPHYTKPAEFEGLKVPDVLISGDHGKIAEWRKTNRKNPN
ncbi:tRNA (guanosine(37)-N1)-methyltransferase TrmD [Candidatus Peregrinibacteria bacterium]|jgi:tRNA (guanine37-N1)-methyltransferase|nr:tRNA (guanosine(37)-N1)-methyltransferase TrmD [Candidatus Peregrinibacteria bacterium]MBT5516784.1 tRNA (guanosine(37)-N1)-methyltransferase TrmD [Candidatus Peregrinibacteria bacterium]MBT5823934.1 tRNA (guanosine(37)-N1)-methyltransferase TrmD [Candidatus Peregrinibacteria bacterium]